VISLNYCKLNYDKVPIRMFRFRFRFFWVPSAPVSDPTKSFRTGNLCSRPRRVTDASCGADPGRWIPTLQLGSREHSLAATFWSWMRLSHARRDRCELSRRGGSSPRGGCRGTWTPRAGSRPARRRDPFHTHRNVGFRFQGETPKIFQIFKCKK